MKTKLSGPVSVGSRTPATRNDLFRIVIESPALTPKKRATWLPSTTSSGASGTTGPCAARAASDLRLRRSAWGSIPNTCGASVKGSALELSMTGNMTRGAARRTPGTSESRRSCSPERRAPRARPIMPPVPAAATVICPEAKSRPPSTRRESFSASAPSRTSAAAPSATPAVVSALRRGRRRRLRRPDMARLVFDDREDGAIQPMKFATAVAQALGCS